MTDTGPREPPTVFQWLIERGQPEGEVQPIWWTHHPRAGWTMDANEAAMFPTRQEALAFMESRDDITGRAVEHGFWPVGALTPSRQARPTPVEPEARPLRAALERLLAVAMVEEEDWSPATQSEWIAAIEQANDALDGLAVEPDGLPLDVEAAIEMLAIRLDAHPDRIEAALDEVGILARLGPSEDKS